MSTDVEDLAMGLNSAAIHLTRRLRRADESLETTPARLSALSVLVFGGPRSIGELAKVEQVTTPTMSKIVAALHEQGYVERRPAPDDGRVVMLEPTSQGRELMERGRRQRVEQLAKELRLLGPAELSTLEQAVAVLNRLEARTLPGRTSPV